MYTKLVISTMALLGLFTTHVHAATGQKNHSKIFASFVRKVLEKSEVEAVYENKKKPCTISEDRIRNAYPLLTEFLDNVIIYPSPSRVTIDKESVISRIVVMAKNSVSNFLVRDYGVNIPPHITGPFDSMDIERGIIEYYTHSRTVEECMAAFLGKDNFSIEDLKNDFLAKLTSASNSQENWNEFMENKPITSGIMATLLPISDVSFFSRDHKKEVDVIKKLFSQVSGTELFKQESLHLEAKHQVMHVLLEYSLEETSMQPILDRLWKLKVDIPFLLEGEENQELPPNSNEIIDNQQNDNLALPNNNDGGEIRPINDENNQLSTNKELSKKKLVAYISLTVTALGLSVFVLYYLNKKKMRTFQGNRPPLSS